MNEQIPPTPAPAAKPPIDDSTQKAESQLMSVSIRGWITVIVVSTICGMEIFKIGVSEPLYSMSLIIVGFYFGQKAKPTTAADAAQPKV